MEADFPVFLDACVLANHAVTDLLLRVADGPRLFCPHWTEKVLEETRRTLLVDLSWPQDLVDYRESEMRQHFPEAMISGFEPLIERMTNSPEDRHVLAGAVWGNCGALSTFNLRDFPEVALAPWEVEAVHPGELLCDLYDLNESAVPAQLYGIAKDRNRTLAAVLTTLNRFVPNFVGEVTDRLGLEMDLSK